jgi:zinc resistance-associated protein
MLCHTVGQRFHINNPTRRNKMKRTNLRSALVITAILIFTGAGIVWAHGGWDGGYGGPMMGYGGGYGGHMMGYGGGYGGHMMGYGGGYGPMMGPGYYGPGYANLSPEQANKLDAARDKFYDQTRDLREKMDEKNYAIQEELNKETPNRDKIQSLQGELSQLRSQYDQYAIDYDLAVREIAPNAARGPAYAGGYRGGYCY